MASRSFHVSRWLKHLLSLFPGSNSRHIGQIADYICGNLSDILLEICAQIVLVVL